MHIQEVSGNQTKHVMDLTAKWKKRPLTTGMKELYRECTRREKHLKLDPSKKEQAR